MKYTFLFLLIVYRFFSLGQASSSAEFQLKVKFDETIEVEKVQPSYIRKSGNALIHINYTVDPKDNSITLFGDNDFILWVGFPVIVFSVTEKVNYPELDTKVERTFHFYLVSQSPVSSYTGKQTKDLLLTYETPILVNSLKYHNHDNAFKELQTERRSVMGNFPGDFSLGVEMIKIEKQ